MASRFVAGRRSIGTARAAVRVRDRVRAACRNLLAERRRCKSRGARWRRHWRPQAPTELAVLIQRPNRTTLRAWSNKAHRSYTSRNGVTEMQCSSSAAMSVPFSGGVAIPPIRDPVIRIAAAVLALIDMQAVLPVASLGGNRDPLDFLRRPMGKLTLIRTVAANAFRDDTADDLSRSAGSVSQNGGRPVRSLARAPGDGTPITVPSTAPATVPE